MMIIDIIQSHHDRLLCRLNFSRQVKVENHDAEYIICHSRYHAC
jgi:hypothetical protein